MESASDFLKWCQVFGVKTGGGGGSEVTQYQVQQQAFNYATDSGSANAVVLALAPVPTTYSNMLVSFECENNNTGATTINCGLTAVPLVVNDNQALVGGELVAGGSYLALYNADISSFVLINSSLDDGTVTPSQVQSFSFNYGMDSNQTIRTLLYRLHLR